MGGGGPNPVQGDPVVIAMPEPMAEGMGGLDTPIGWSIPPPWLVTRRAGIEGLPRMGPVPPGQDQAELHRTATPSSHNRP